MDLEFEGQPHFEKLAIEVLEPIFEPFRGKVSHVANHHLAHEITHYFPLPFAEGMYCAHWRLFEQNRCLFAAIESRCLLSVIYSTLPKALTEGTRLANRLGAMRRRPRTPYPVLHPEEFVTLHIDERIEAKSRGPARKVLLLEDRDDFREVLRDHLVFRSYEVTDVRSGVEGLREIMKGAFDLIICDMMMPQVGGEMFYWAVTRARPAAARRFIFFTGHQNNPAIDFFFRRVNAIVLIKPFKLVALDSAIYGVFSKVH